MTSILNMLLTVVLVMYAAFAVITWVGLMNYPAASSGESDPSRLCQKPFYSHFYSLRSILTGLLAQLRLKPTKKQGHEEPFVSVIVVARDEEKTLPQCLRSLGKLDYPREKLEWILVNDRSSDATEKIMRAFADGKPQARVISIHTLSERWTGKTNGLIQGVQKARGDVFFFTDADCVVPETWIKTTLGYFTPKTGIVSGFLILDRQEDKFRFFPRLQSLDWIAITAVGCGWSNLGLPLSAFGNNLAIRRQAYDQAGGFEAAGKHLIEDFALTRNVVRTGQYEARIALDSGNAVYTRPATTVREFSDQRKRWALGGKNHGPLVWSMMSTAFLAHALIPIGLVLGAWTAGFGAFAIITVLDGFMLFHPLRTLKRLDLVRYIPLYELYYFAYSILIAPAFFLVKKVQWKSGTYHVEK